MSVRTFERPQKPIGAWKRLLGYCGRDKTELFFALLCAIAGTVLTLLGPEKLKNMTDLISAPLFQKTDIDMQAVSAIGVSLTIFYLASMLLSLLQGRITATVTQRISHRMRSDISRKINRLPMSFYNRTTTGDILSRVTNDVDAIGQSLNQSISNLVSSSTQLVGALILMFAQNVLMSVTAVLSSVVGFVLIFLIMRRSQTFFLHRQECLGNLNGHIEEVYAGHNIIKAYNGETAAQNSFAELNEALRSSGFNAMCLSSLMQPLMSFIGNFGYVAVCVVGALLVLNGSVGFGMIVAFILYVRYFTQPLNQIAQSMQSLQTAAAAAERVFDFLSTREMSEESAKPKRLNTVKGLVEFDHVRFGYEDSDRIMIQDFSAVAKPGQKIAIVGPTGAGKTTLVNLLLRFHEQNGGEIRIDGVPISEMTRREVRAQFCMVLQDTWLFEGTLRENLVYNTPDVTQKQLEAACEAVGLEHFVRTLPHGYDTVLSEQVSLSQGEKQQITIARAILADKPMLILDEATSSVDTRTELKIQRAMDRLMENRTSFVIAHRLSTIKDADLILVLRDGDVVESGTHAALMRKNGFYAELYNSQFDHRP